MNQVILNSVSNFQFHQNPLSHSELFHACEHQTWQSWRGLAYDCQTLLKCSDEFSYFKYQIFRVSCLRFMSLFMS
jgi:hypothetical protein